MSDLDDLFLGDPAVLAALDNIERQHQQRTSQSHCLGPGSTANQQPQQTCGWEGRARPSEGHVRPVANTGLPGPSHPHNSAQPQQLEHSWPGPGPSSGPGSAHRQHPGPGPGRPVPGPGPGSGPGAGQGPGRPGPGPSPGPGPGRSGQGSGPGHGPGRPGQGHGHQLHPGPIPPEAFYRSGPAQQPNTRPAGPPGDRPQLQFQATSAPQGAQARQQLGAQPQPQQRGGPKVTVKVVLLADRRVGFRFGYNDALLAIIKRVEGREFDHSRKLWTVPTSRMEDALQALRACPGFSVSVDPLPQIVSTVLQAASKSPDDSSRYSNIPKDMERQMMEFQREGVMFGLAHGGRVLLGDEMGLGKTVQAVALMACYREEWPCLIITPSSLREQWADALHRWLGVTDTHIHIVYEKKDMLAASKGRFKFLIISYDYVTKMKQELERKAFQVIVCDESHYIKNHKAVRTKETVPLLKRARRCILCSGTPALSRPIEILQQMLALLPTAKVSVDKFAERYCQGSQWSKLSGASNLDELHALCTTSILIRRLKKSVLDQLPPKMRQQITLQLSDKDMGPVRGVQQQLVAVKVALQQCQNSDGDVNGAKMEEKRLLNELYLKSAEAKIKAVQEYVVDLLEADSKFLIFAHHQCLLDGIEQCLRRRKVQFIRIDGATAAHERQGLVTSFQENSSCKVAVLSIRAAGQGLTLTAASLVVMAELSWTPGELVQAEDRAHRIGQADSVSVHYLHARNTIDDIIWQTIQNKLDNVGQTLNGCQDKLQVQSSSNSTCKGGAGKSILGYMKPRGSQHVGASPVSGARPTAGQHKRQDEGQPSQGTEKRRRGEHARGDDIVPSQGRTLFDLWGKG